MSVPHLVYLHGFLSGPGSSKARETAAFMDRLGLADHFHCPELPPVPAIVEARLREIFIALEGQPACVVGSSLGGFYATWAAETFGWRAVLLNPAVRPYEFVKDYTGPQRNYVTGEVQIVDASLAEDLRAMERRQTTGCWCRPATKRSTTARLCIFTPGVARRSLRAASTVLAAMLKSCP